MIKIVAKIGEELYKTEIESANNMIISDEPESNGGKDLGFAPKELLASSLAACTCITLRMYANRKGWDLTDIKVEVTFDKDSTENKSKMICTIQLFGDLDNDQKTRLLSIANKCPIHKILTSAIEITTELN
ncbi:OsmC family protein [Flavobacterium gawalongense]|uniref:OsmC family protein n=1 Tax=Flavobacterium gawalongense TaxID=2594432 RepID=A0A553BLI1_9FLAO|nr:OsmC family protein [Flavobacterium gawalongense]TRX00814.1 OsmC family protein [Flavobacterium gawalongense]TRX05114.1 OsmC family protein [Flavobacterium gawalongense]TRX09106.1 OsmC family protein [Flavobacterium gawalongense]TRX10241.1 OsmC family protein [Flavobacterium gawalongense]TRX27091.1 OsmC family protein [Flavobacterium gawalongense]